MKPTSQCPKVPNHPWLGPFRKPCKDLSDGEIDVILQAMLDQIGEEVPVSGTQYGRRIAVEIFLSFEKIPHSFTGQRPWEPDQPTQPR